VVKSRACGIVGSHDQAYLMFMAVPPAEGVSVSEAATGSSTRLSGPLVAIAAFVAVLLAGTAVLWAHYGTAVFYEMIVAGLAACL
jgi:hypothetical protein